MIVTPLFAERKTFGARINPRHPLAPFVCFAYYFNDEPLGTSSAGGHLKYADSSNNKLDATALSSSVPPRILGTYGTEVKAIHSLWMTTPTSLLFNTGTLGNSGNAPGIPITILSRIKSTGSNAAQCIAAKNYDGSSGIDWALSITQNSISTNAGGMAYFTGAAWVGTGIGGVTIANDQLYHQVAGTIAPRTNAGVNNTLTYYIDGVQIAQTTNTATYGQSTTTPKACSIGTYNADTSQGLDGNIEYIVMLRGVALSPAQIARWTANPYGIIAPPERLFRGIAGSAVGRGARTYVVCT